jgi:O-antigen ligase
VWSRAGLRPALRKGFEIVRRRLFQPTESHLFTARDAVVRTFSDLYRMQAQELPSGCHDGGYERRTKAAYPIYSVLDCCEQVYASSNRLTVSKPCRLHVQNVVPRVNHPIPTALILLCACSLVTAGSVFFPLATGVSLALLLATAALLSYPTLGLYVMMTFFLIQDSPLYNAFGILSRSLTAADIVGVLVLLAWLLRWARQTPHSRTLASRGRDTRVFLFVAAYFLWKILSSFWSPAPAGVLVGSLQHDVEHALFFGLVILLLVDAREVRRAAAVYAVVGTGLALYTIFTFGSHQGFAHAALVDVSAQTFRGGLPGTFNANEMSTILVVVPAFAFLAAGDLSRRVQILITGILVPIIGVTLIILTSREMFVAVPLALLAIVLVSRGYRPRFALALVVLVSAGTFAALVYTANVPPYVQNRINATQSDNFGDRLPLWSEGLDMFTSHPVAGLGTQGFEATFNHAAENEYILTLANQGLIGFVLLLLMLAALGRVLVLDAERNPASIAIAAVVLVSLAASDFLELHWMWVILSIATCHGLRAAAQKDALGRRLSHPARFGARQGPGRDGQRSGGAAVTAQIE